MREIEFRAKDIDNSKWVYGSYAKVKTFSPSKLFSNEPVKYKLTPMIFNKDGDMIPVNIKTVGQFTGLYDKKGNEIFEGDIFGDSKRTEIDVVVFEDGCFKLKSYGFVECCLDGNAYEERWGEWDCQPICNFCLEHDEILGNVHDNPELLTPREM